MDDVPLGIVARAEERFAFYTGQASSVCRTLGLSAVAIAWLFSTREATTDTNAADATFNALLANDDLRTALNFAIWFLILDGVQYVSAACLWGLHRWATERLVRTDGFDASLVGYIAYYVADAFGTVGYLRRAADIDGKKRRYRSLVVVINRDRDDPKAPVVQAQAEPLAPGFIPLTTTGLFVAKVVCLVVAYHNLLRFLQ